MTTPNQTLTEFLQGEGVDINATSTLKASTHIQAERRATVDLLSKLIHNATLLRTELDTEDVHVFAYAARRHSGHAGYSNSLSTMATEVMANTASMTARLEGLL